jgi:hypothetical protein
MSIAQLDVVVSDEMGSYSSDETLGGLFIHDVWNGDVRRLSGLWHWKPMIKHHIMPPDSRWVRDGAGSGRWTVNGNFLDLYIFQTKVAFLRWWGGDPVGYGIPRYPLQTGALLIEKPAGTVYQPASDPSQWMNIGYRVQYVDEPTAIPWHFHR